MNKKLIKILTCSACGLGIATSIPFMATSCGGSSTPTPEPKPYEGIPLPDDVYDIDKITGTLNGFKSDIDWTDEKYADCEVMELPKGITNIKADAFNNKITENIRIKVLDLSNLTEATDISENAFKTNVSIITLVMPKKIKSVAYHAFDGFWNLFDIYWDWYGVSTSDFNKYSFGINNDDYRKAYSLSKKGTEDQFREFLSYFKDAYDRDTFEKWTLVQY